MSPSRVRALLVGTLLVLLSLGVQASAASAATAPETEVCRGLDPAVQGRTRVVTVPAVPGFRFLGGGRTFTTGSDGTTEIPAALASCPLEPMTEEMALDEGRSAVLSRWYRPAARGTASRVYAAFDVYQETRLSFRGADGRRIPRSSLGQVLLKNSLGVLVDVDRGDVVRLPAARVVPRTPLSPDDPFYLKELNYTVERIDVNGNTLVNRSQTRFSPADQRVVEIPLIYHAVTVRAQDAFFGGAIGHSVALRYPDGRVDEYPLDDQGLAVLDLLPRGDYELQVSAAGLKGWRPLALSRPQEVELKVLSYLDVAVVVGTGAALALVVLVIGLRLRQYRGRHHRGQAKSVHVRGFRRTGRSRERWPSARPSLR